MADIVWKTTKLPDAIIGAPYEASLAITGAATALTASTTTPSLPAGLSFSAEKLRITGTPTGPAQAWTGTITLTDTAGAVASSSITFAVRDAVRADAIQLGSGKAGADVAKLRLS